MCNNVSLIALPKFYFEKPAIVEILIKNLWGSLFIGTACISVVSSIASAFINSILIFFFYLFHSGYYTEICHSVLCYCEGSSIVHWRPLYWWWTGNTTSAWVWWTGKYTWRCSSSTANFRRRSLSINRCRHHFVMCACVLHTCSVGLWQNTRGATNNVVCYTDRCSRPTGNSKSSAPH